jgi:Zn-dependent protease
MRFVITYGPLVAFAIFIATLVVVRLFFRRSRVEINDKGLVVDRTFAFGWPDIRRLDFWVEKGVARYVVHLGASRYAFTHREASLDDPLRLKHMIIEKSRLQREGNGAPRVETWVRHGDTGILPKSLLESLPRPSPPGVVGAAAGAALLWLAHAKWITSAVSLVASAGAYGLMARLLNVSFHVSAPIFACGILAIVLIHELGHAWVMRTHGIRAGLPVFIPFVGAFIALRDQPRDAMVESEIGFGGPLAGGIAASAAYVVYWLTRDPNWLIVAAAGFMLNAFNMLPMPPLDGGRIVSAVSPRLWFGGVAILVLFFALTWRRPDFIVPNVFVLFIASVGFRDAVRIFTLRRKPAVEEYYNVPLNFRIAMACSWILLGAFLAGMTWQCGTLLAPYWKPHP